MTDPTEQTLPFSEAAIEAAAPEREHSSWCRDVREVDGGDACVCEPDKQAPPPDAYELWWCSWCGEPSCEDADPCQRCGEAIKRVPYIAAPGEPSEPVERVAQWLYRRDGEEWIRENWDTDTSGLKDQYRREARELLAALGLPVAEQETTGHSCGDELKARPDYSVGHGTPDDYRCSCGTRFVYVCYVCEESEGAWWEPVVETEDGP